MEICRSQLLTVTGVISITFDFRKKRAIIRVKHDLKPEVRSMLLAYAKGAYFTSVVLLCYNNKPQLNTNIKLFIINSLQVLCVYCNSCWRRQ